MPAANRVYSGDDRNVIPPNVINQTLPVFQGAVFAPRYGMLEVLISETGEIESAVMTQSVTVAYDRLAIAAARKWRYTPATVNGVPVKYRKAVQISVKSGS
jgi:TonB family protein